MTIRISKTRGDIYTEPSFKELLVSVLDLQSFLNVKGDNSLICVLVVNAISKRLQDSKSNHIEVDDIRIASNAFKLCDLSFSDHSVEFRQFYESLKLRADHDSLSASLALLLADFADWSTVGRFAGTSH